MASHYVCHLCDRRLFANLKSYLWHLRIRHANDAQFRVECGVLGCRNVYDKYSSFYKHIRRKHSNLSDCPGENCEMNELDEIHDNDEIDHQREAVDIFCKQNAVYTEINNSLLLYSLKLREKFLLTASAHAEIMHDSKSFVMAVLQRQNELISCQLANKGYCLDEDTVLQRILCADEMEHALNDYSSEYQLLKCCGEKLGLIYPQLHKFGDYKSYYVPLTKVLQMLVKADHVLPYVLNDVQPITACTDCLTDFFDGSNFTLISALKKEGHMLYLHLYNDEFDVVNPIGAKRGKHKMNVTYFTLGNLPTELRSNLQHIFLTNIVKHNAVKSEGYLTVFSPLAEELKKLFTDGFSVAFDDGHQEKFFAVLCTVSGDNLSSHALAGFRQVFNSGRVCRFCMISHNQLSQKSQEDEVVLRNATNHAYHVKAVGENPDNAGIYGVCGPSVFSSLDYFEVISGFPPDIMHDCMEGVIPKVTETIVKFLVEKKLITVLKFNRNLSKFEFKGEDKVNKPEPLKADCGIIGSASQKMCLFRFLPFLVELNQHANVMKLYVLAREVMMYVFARRVSLKDLDYLGQKIQGLLMCLQENFPAFHFTPKFHYLIHYPTLMAKHGPLRNLWCMRFEAKHQYFKQVASTLGNFINIAFSLAMRHQMLQCYQFSGKNDKDTDLTLTHSGKFVPFAFLPLDVQRCVCYASSRIWSVREATAHSCKFTVGAVVLIDFTTDGNPVFLKILYLLSPHDGHLDIIGKLLISESFSKKFYAHKVIDCGWGHFHPGSEKDCTLLWPYELQGDTFITMPYNVTSCSCI